MLRLARFAVVSFVSFFLAVCVAAADSPQILAQHPTISATQIVFAYAGDLWTVPREGGVAKRLTAGIGVKSRPVFSPDGSEIAFTAICRFSVA